MIYTPQSHPDPVRDATSDTSSGRPMLTKRCSAEEIVSKLRKAEAGLGRRMSIDNVCRMLGLTEPMYYRLRSEVRRSQRPLPRRVNELEAQNTKPVLLQRG